MVDIVLGVGRHRADGLADRVLDQVRQAHWDTAGADRVVEAARVEGTPQFIGGLVLEANGS